MKKIIATILITVYCFASAGTTIAMHYCMGDMVSTTMGYSEQAVCQFCHMDKHSAEDMGHCCKDENQFYKVSPDQDLSSFAVCPNMPVANLSQFLSDARTVKIDCALPQRFSGKIDPPDIPVYQRNCNFRI